MKGGCIELFLIACLSTTAVHEDEKNLVANPGFVSLKEDNGMPTHWSIWQPNWSEAN